MLLGLMLKNATFVLTVAIAAAAFGAETPHEAWVHAKCAVCHAEDGSGSTREGKRRNVPDLRSAAVQKHSDAELVDIIITGHGKMPSFQMSKERAATLVMYIRSLAKT